jgi:flagellar biosynthesis protein FlhG
MLDQAFKLRELIQSAVPSAPAVPTGLPMIAVAGGRTGVGATTVAANLAAVMADAGERVVLVDAARQHANMDQVVGVNPRIKFSLNDVVNGRCSAADALVPGPAGTMLLPGVGTGADADFSRRVQQQLLAELQTLEKVATLLVVDCGPGLTPWTRRFWLRSKLVMLVTTSDNSALLDSYTTIKQSERDSISADVRVLANQCDSDTIAADVCRRLSTASERFLSRPVAALPALPWHDQSSGTAAGAVPRVWESPNSAFGHAMLWLGRAVCDVLQLDCDVPARESGFGMFQPREFSRC